jgi:hypothetical protein
MGTKNKSGLCFMLNQTLESIDAHMRDVRAFAPTWRIAEDQAIEGIEIGAPMML